MIRYRRTTVDIDCIDGKIRELRIQNYYEFICNMEINKRDLFKVQYTFRNLVRF